MRLINYDKLDPKYDRMIYIDNNVYTYTKPKGKTALTVRLVARIIIIDGLDDPEVEKVYQKPKKIHKIFYKYKDGYEKYFYMNYNLLIEKHPELFEIEKKVTNYIKVNK